MSELKKELSWHDCRDTLNSAAWTLVNNDILEKATDVLHFYEKPWKWKDELEDLGFLKSKCPNCGAELETRETSDPKHDEVYYQEHCVECEYEEENVSVLY